MELVAFSVTNYRSITTAYRLPTGRSTILIGPNNEGKSNILRALVTALEFLSRIGGVRIQKGRFRSSAGIGGVYTWASDFPISLQEKQPDGESVFNVDLRLTEDEIADFVAEVGSKLNGDLPIQLTLGKQQAGFKVLKKGPGGAALSKKSEKIALFIAKRINLSYIPAVRTASTAHEVVDSLLEKELAVVESDPAYRSALEAVAALQKPILERISGNIKETLKEFLPNVKEVRVTIPEEERFRALRRACEIVVNDGTPTQLAKKGDGVQSLAALSLLRHASVSTGLGKNLILAIEEPESHLHPSAIHQLREVIGEIAQKHQVIMTTHCPLFVDRAAVKSNILVHRSKARPAKSIVEIRKMLGVRAADNLQHAELILLVEGEDDRRALRALLSHSTSLLRSAIAQGTLGIDTLQGGSNLPYKLGQVRETLCSAYSFLDNDKSGVEAADRAVQEGLSTWADITLTSCDGMPESEIEDMYDTSLYEGMILAKYGVSLLSPRFKGNGKWSDRLKATFKHQGKSWTDVIEMKVKLDVAEIVETNPAAALNVHKRNSFDALVSALETRFAT